METVAVIAKDDCRVFCYINSLGDKISNTAALIQPNPFWFWYPYIKIFCAFNFFEYICKNSVSCILYGSVYIEAGGGLYEAMITKVKDMWNS